MARSEWVDKSELPPLPPKEEWGSNKDFKTHTKKGKPRCQRFSKRKLRMGKRGAAAQCPLPAKAGFKTCHKHTRRKKPRTLQEEFSRYKKSIPQHLLAKLLHAAQDPDRLSQTAELDLLTVRISEILERIDTKQSEIAWRNVQDGYDMISQAIRDNDPNGIKNGMSVIRRALSSSDYHVWHEFTSLVMARKSVLESERRRMLEQAEMISIEELMGVIAHLQQGLMGIITDQSQRTAISDLFLALYAPDINELPDPARKEKKPHKPWFASHPNTRKDEGCTLCRNEEIRARNSDENGLFTCPDCGMTWEMKIIDGEVN